MKLAEIRKMDTKQLIENVEEVRGEIAQLKRSVHMGESNNVRMIRTKRKQLARMLTVIGEQFQKEKV